MSHIVSRPTPSELAQTWHEGREETDPEHSEVFSSCWCCCWKCDPDDNEAGGNPHWAAAVQASRG